MLYFIGSTVLKKLSFLLVLFFIGVILLTALSNSFSIHAQFNDPNPSQAPDNCADSNGDGVIDQDDYTVDFACEQQRIFRPGTTCLLVCKESINENTSAVTDELVPLFGTFSTRIQVDSSERIAVLVNLTIVSVFALISIYALVMGIYVGGVKRAQATTEEDIASANKTLQNLIIGFVIAVGAVIIVQLIFLVLGLGDLTSIEFTQDDPQIIIN